MKFTFFFYYKKGNEKAFQYITEWIYQIKEEAKKNVFINLHFYNSYSFLFL